MLILVTGSPGAGKTSNTLWSFLNDPEYQNRPRFCVDIPDFDAARHGVGLIDTIEKWEELPDGSVVLIDESQRFLRPRSSRAVPDWLGAFETHRHRGFDFLFITQHPSLIDSHVRRLVGRHVHYYRPFGLKSATRVVWEFCQDNPTLVTFKTGQSERVKVNPKVFTLYRSTTVDTHKAKLPWKILLTGALAAAVAVGGFAWLFLGFGAKHATKSETTPPVVAASPSGSPTGAGLGSPVPAVDGRREFKVTDLVPRERSMPWTAPYYDDLTRPTDFPRLAACIESAKGCNCYTQQATPMDVDLATCKAIVKNGVFDQWKTGRQQQANDQQPAQQNAQNVTGEVLTKETRAGNVGASVQPVGEVSLAGVSSSSTPHYTTDVFNQAGYR